MGLAVADSVGQSGLNHPHSDLADKDLAPCIDTVNVLVKKLYFDIGRLLPEWHPVLHPDSLHICEGKVVPVRADYSSCHISPLDFSGYHYTHDLSFDVLPDPAFRGLLAKRMYEREGGKIDTVDQTTMHCEWESGIATGVRRHPFGQIMREGGSCGFLTAGHQRGERLWSMPSIGDWVHLEGLWIWDRGHPPARTEIHPIRFMGIVRNLPDWIPTGQGDSVFATRVDMFGSGDGGALMNNRKNQPSFVRPTRMSDKAYSFVVKPALPRPHPGCELNWRVEKHAADNFLGSFEVTTTDNGLLVRADWRNQPDSLILARTLHCWWSVPGGKSPDLKVHTYEVKLSDIRIHRRREGLSRSEWRFFTEVGGQWHFENEQLPGKDILNLGKAKSFTRRWPLNRSLVVHVPEGVAFRIYGGGWEADGTDWAFGQLFDPTSPCTPQTKKAMRKHLLVSTPLGLKGCLDDMLGIAQAFPNPESLGEGGNFKVSTTGPDDDYDQCPGVSIVQAGSFSLSYQVKKIQTR
jgi:hypothetical protein